MTAAPEIGEVCKINKQETFTKSQSEERTPTGSGGRSTQILDFSKSTNTTCENILFNTNLSFVFL